MASLPVPNVPDVLFIESTPPPPCPPSNPAAPPVRPCDDRMAMPSKHSHASIAPHASMRHVRQTVSDNPSPAQVPTRPRPRSRPCFSSTFSSTFLVHVL